MRQARENVRLTRLTAFLYLGCAAAPLLAQNPAAGAVVPVQAPSTVPPKGSVRPAPLIEVTLPASDPLAKVVVTPSMRATAKYFWVVIALFLVQILLGATTAHYQVEGQEAYGFALAEILPYSLTRTWHTQLAVLWIATAWLGMGLYIGPAISGHEPKFQALGVHVLWVCLIIIVVGSFAGQWFAVMQKLGLANNFWYASSENPCCPTRLVYNSTPRGTRIMASSNLSITESTLSIRKWCIPDRLERKNSNMLRARRETCVSAGRFPILGGLLRSQ